MSRRLKQFVSRSMLNRPFVKQVSVLAGGTAFSQLILVAASPVLTRLYTPEQFGVLSVYVALLSIFTVIGSMQYEQAIPIVNDQKGVSNLLALCVLLLALVCLLLLLGTVAFADAIGQITETEVLASSLWLLPFSLFGAGLYQIMNGWAVREKQFSELAKTKLSQSFGMMSVQIGGGFLHFGSWGLLIGDAIGRVSGSTRLFQAMKRKQGFSRADITFSSFREVAKRYMKFPLMSTWSSGLNQFGLQLPAFMLAVYYGPAAVGWYALAQRVIGIPFQVIGSSVGEVYLAEAAKISREKGGRLQTLFWKTVKHMTVLAFPIALLLFLAAPWAFRFVFGQAWGPSGDFLSILSVMFFFQFITSPVAGALQITERQDLHLIREVIRVGLLAFALFLANWTGRSALTAIVYVSIAGSVGYLVHGFLSWYAIHAFSSKCKQGRSLSSDK